MKPRFLISDSKGRYLFQLLSSNGKVLMRSQYYATKSSCRRAIESVRRSVPDAIIIPVN